VQEGAEDKAGALLFVRAPNDTSGDAWAPGRARRPL